MNTDYASRSGDTLPMAVANMTFLVNRLGNDCAPLQFVRELTQNAIEGIAQAADSQGEVVWDVDWNYYDLSNDGTMKLCCIDTGAGMTGTEMVKHINQLSSSIHEQSATGNFGVGAKISAGPRNPHGLVYMSWKGGVGHMIHLWLDPEENVYGLKRWLQNSGEFWTPVSNDLKPKQIGDHGTVVVLLGKSDEENTIDAPVGTAMRSRWILRYLNTRYFQFPIGIKVQAREGWENPRTDKHNFLRAVEGQGPWLNRNAESKGSVVLSNATAHWWILKGEVDRDSGHYAPGGHIAALYQNELYEMTLRSGGGIAKLQMFGVIFGSDRVAIYVEPNSSEGKPVTANTARTQLLIDNEPMDWSAWAADFRASMPDEIKVLQEEIGAHSGDKSYKQKILDRLKDIRDLLRFSRARPSPSGIAPIDDETRIAGGESASGDQTRTGQRAPGNKGGKSGDIFALFAESGDSLGNPDDSVDDPEVKWVKMEDGSRVPPDLNDRAGRFLIQQNLLIINADFRVFTDMVDRWVNFYGHVPGSETTVREVVHEWFEQQLTETVMSAKALKRTGRWSYDELAELWSENSLTAAVLPRWHIDQSIKRNLGQRLGTLKAAA